MAAPYEVKTTAKSGGKLLTHRFQCESVDNVLAELEKRVTTPTEYEVRLEYEMLVSLMTDGNQVQLTLWTPDTCCYLCRSATQDESGSVDMGWNSFPAWSVTSDLSEATRAIRQFLESRKLDPTLHWLCEEAKR